MDTSLFACPVCGGMLTKTMQSLQCQKGHSFDISGSGYVNLLLANQMNSHDPGDDRAMVQARAAFLARGYYAPLRRGIEAVCVRYADQAVRLLDLGCGEGYYTSGVGAALEQAKKSPHVAGVDIAKTAAKLAARQAKGAEIAVASVFHLPLSGESMDLLLNCFSPLCMEEVGRVLKPGGHFIYVVPGAKHLWELKCAVYEQPYENDGNQLDYGGFRHCETVSVSETIHLEQREDIQNLFRMTPYFWKTATQDREKLFAKTEMNTQIAFHLLVYEKTE